METVGMAPARGMVDRGERLAFAAGGAVRLAVPAAQDEAEKGTVVGVGFCREAFGVPGFAERGAAQVELPPELTEETAHQGSANTRT